MVNHFDENLDFSSSAAAHLLVAFDAARLDVAQPSQALRRPAHGGYTEGGVKTCDQGMCLRRPAHGELENNRAPALHQHGAA